MNFNELGMLFRNFK